MQCSAKHIYMYHFILILPEDVTDMSEQAEIMRRAQGRPDTKS